MCSRRTSRPLQGRSAQFSGCAGIGMICFLNPSQVVKHRLTHDSGQFLIIPTILVSDLNSKVGRFFRFLKMVGSKQKRRQEGDEAELRNVFLHIFLFLRTAHSNFFPFVRFCQSSIPFVVSYSRRATRLNLKKK